MADGGRSPEARRRGTITPEMQREMMGELDGRSLEGGSAKKTRGNARSRLGSVESDRLGDGENANGLNGDCVAGVTPPSTEVPTPDTFVNRKGKGAAATSKADSSLDATADELEAAAAVALGGAKGRTRRSPGDDKNQRETLSPSKVQMLIQQEAADDDDAVRRNDTASPRTLARLIDEMSVGVTGGSGARGSKQSVVLKSAEKSRKREQDHLAQSIEYLEASRLALLDSPAASTRAKQKSRRNSQSPSLEAASSNTTKRSPPTKSPGKRARSPAKTTPSPKHAKTSPAKNIAQDTTEIDSFVLSSSLLNPDGVNASPSGRDNAAQDRRITLGSTAAESMMAELRDVRKDESEEASRKGDPNRRKTIEIQPTASSSASTTRRTTIDPHDVLLMQSEGRETGASRASATEEDNERRQTIGENDLQELAGVLENGADQERVGRSTGMRKRTNAFDAAADSGIPKRQKVVSSSSRLETIGVGDSESDEDEATSGRRDAKTSSASKKNAQISRKTVTATKPAENKAKISSSAAAGMGSPPIQDPRGGKGPLRGILSARKRPKDQTTPNKSVNFGPSEGAEFNMGSPSTSMTPMLAREAKVMFPLDRPSSPDDEETSLNSSLLDEADARSPDIDKGQNNEDDTLDGTDRQSSLLLIKSANKNRRRYSLRGVSPLDNQAAARRRRRSSVVGGSPSLSRLSLSNHLPPPSTAKNSAFLADDGVAQARTAYADSSASSDVGEDMDITGDYSFQASTVLRDDEKRMSSQPDSQDVPDEDHTVELGSLGDLLVESAAYMAALRSPASSSKQAPAKPVSSIPLSSNVVKLIRAGGGNEDHSITLDPILEESESMANSSRQSMMSLATEESDNDEDERRTSLVVNLSSQFERIGSATKSGEGGASTSDHDAAARDTKKIYPSSPTKPRTGPKPPVRLSTTSFDTLLPSMELEKATTVLTAGAPFFDENQAASLFAKQVGYSCSFDTCTSVVEWHAQEISSWSSGVNDILSSLLEEKAPWFLDDDEHRDAVKELIKGVFAVQSSSVRSGWCQWRAKMERQLSENLGGCADDLQADVDALKASVEEEALRRQSEVAAIRELIDREQQMSRLLDAIEEQQAVRDEYATSVEALENQCSELSLEESVQQSQLQVLEGKAHELEPVTTGKSLRTQRSLLEVEEVFAIQESLTGWHVVDAGSAELKLQTKFEDVIVDIDVSVSVVIHSDDNLADGESFSSTLQASESVKRKYRSGSLTPDRDVVLLAQRRLFDPDQLAAVVKKARGKPSARSLRGQLSFHVQLLQNYVAQAFQFLQELRRLSMHYSLTFDAKEKVLWAKFIKFPSASSRHSQSTAAVKFRVGLPFIYAAPFTTNEAKIEVAYGPVRAFVCVLIVFPHGLTVVWLCVYQVSTEAIQREIVRVPHGRVEFLTRLYRRLFDAFVRE